MNEHYALHQLLHLVDRSEHAAIRPEEAAELRAAIRALYARPAADREIALHRRMTKAVEAAVDDYRELTCQWTEADGSTQEIARRATAAAFGAVRAVVPITSATERAAAECVTGAERATAVERVAVPGRIPAEAGAR
ncbi:hypothetical protein [Streptomyces lasiicapitis]|uniref:hypothetical protein n=1 Tax=Streptomyces lasiicapitis TaxID=1923961 RepID=UPI0036C65546